MTTSQPPAADADPIEAAIESVMHQARQQLPEPPAPRLESALFVPLRRQLPGKA